MRHDRPRRQRTRGAQFGGEARYRGPSERVERTEREEARRRNLEWLRDRDEENTVEYEEDYHL